MDWITIVGLAVVSIMPNGLLSVGIEDTWHNGDTETSGIRLTYSVKSGYFSAPSRSGHC